MKSHVIKAKEQILSYGLDGSQIKLLDQISQKNSITHININATDSNQSIGYLCGFKGFLRAEKQGEILVGKQCLILSGIQRKNIQHILDEIKSSGLNIPLKAMVTPTNQSWILSDLISELEREHEYMTNRKAQK
ncbi:MAG: DUF3783 domain-containing protein [Ruminococcus sp.]|nr:DUF3783 domain-containing protein [Ruminococcus sp.]